MKRIPSAQRGSCPLSFVVVVLFLLSFMSTVISEEIEASIVPPIIDIAPLLHPSDHTIEQIDFTSRQLAQASEQWGFYHVVNHGIDESLLTELEEQMERFFSLPLESKISVKRQENNSRGYANDELTKRTLDLKEVYDFGPDITTLLPLYSEKARENAVIDGINQWIDPTLAPDFRNVVDRYFDASYRLSFALMKATARYLTCFEDPLFFDDKFDLHSSLFRLNYYPIVDKNAETNSGSDRVANGDNEGLGISRHTDAGALTILWQDPRHSSLEVYSGSKQDFADGDWVPVVPVPGALTVNNGDMLQVRLFFLLSTFYCWEKVTNSGNLNLVILTTCIFCAIM